MSRLIYFCTKDSLERASSNSDLFAKEIKKAIKNLLPYEMEHLKNGLIYFSNKKPDLLKYISVVSNIS